MKKSISFREGIVFGRVRFFIEQPLYDSSLQQMFGNDLFGVFRFQFLIEYTFGIDECQRTEIAGTDTTGLDDLYLILQTLFRLSY